MAEDLKTTSDADLAKTKLKYEADKRSWKDEMWTVVLAWPFALTFLPGTQGLAAAGFVIMNTVPAWYVALVGACVAYAFHHKVISLYGLIRSKG